MDSIVRDNPAQRFYLATDDEETKNEMLKRYGDALLMSSSKAERGTTEGIKDAVVEIPPLPAAVRYTGQLTAASPSLLHASATYH